MPPTSPVYKKEDLQKVVHEEQGLVDNLDLSGTDEEKTGDSRDCHEQVEEKETQVQNHY